MKCFLQALEGDPGYLSIKNAIASARLPMGVLGLGSVHKAHYISSLCEGAGAALVVCPDEGGASKLVSDLNSLSGGAVLYPARDFQLRSGESQSREYEQTRIGVLSRILEGSCRFVVCSAEAASQLTLPAEVLKERCVRVTLGQQLEPGGFISLLIAAGYTRTDQVDGTGQFAVRGGILDLYTPQSESPVRIEFWGDSVDSIAHFEADTQRRTIQLKEIYVTPATEILFDSDAVFEEKLRAFAETIKGKGALKAREFTGADIDKLANGVRPACIDKYLPLAYDKPATIFDYMRGCLLFVSESSAVRQRLQSNYKLHTQELRALFEDGCLFKGLDRFMLAPHEIIDRYEQFGAVYMDNLARGSFDTPVKELVTVRARQLPPWDGTLEALTDELRPAIKRGFTCVVMAGAEKAAKELSYDLESAEIKSHFFPVPPAQFPKGSVSVLTGGLSAGMEYPDAAFMLCTYMSGLLGGRKSAVSRAVKKRRGLHSLEEITRGDYIVHAVHGIGVFDGIHKLESSGVTKDYIKIKYAKQDVLYVPVTQLDLVSKYISPADGDGRRVKINRLGSGDWQKTRSRVKGAVRDMAAELTEIYSKRLNSKGYAFSPDIDMQSDFERRFEYDETEDQLVAVNEIKQDMERPCPMDRLLCGDVGFGKTEVALRAAFKCIADGKQCAILVPTTILAFQHYQTIRKRFEGFPIEIEMLSRFRSQSERTQVKKALRRGSVDIVVGTHSIISKGVEFRDLGLLIVDEEQRFGVAQKEKLKEKFPLVDVLTLSATPIPRTLNMSMTGIRDMSILEIPPADRHPVQTYVLEFDMDVLCEAMDREIRRGGQVYYLHNRVDNIERAVSEIRQRLPDARIGVGHGQMGEDELSDVWRMLLEGEIDILVCTTIIETGVDVPNANTLIIEDADKLGLAQLHQIRGRVGRSSRRAFAYLTFRRDKQLTDVAQRRLSAIREYTEFGSGFQIAMRDLEIRGAGNILGSQQHGHMEAVGYDMYLQILNEAVREEKGEKPEAQENECLIDMHVDAHIPEDYIGILKQRIAMYRRIADIRSNADADDVMDELVDRFGEPPAAVKGLIDVSLLRNTAAQLNIYEIAQRNNALLLFCNKIDMKGVARMSRLMRGRVMVSAAGKPYISVKLDSQTPVETLRDSLKILMMK